MLNEMSITITGNAELIKAVVVFVEKEKSAQKDAKEKMREEKRENRRKAKNIIEECIDRAGIIDLTDEARDGLEADYLKLIENLKDNQHQAILKKIK